jgi:hypothetical protein
LEILEEIKAAGSLLTLSSVLGSVALVAASQAASAPAFEQRDTSTDEAAWQTSTDPILSDLVFTHPAAQDDMLWLSHRLPGVNPLSVELEFARGRHTSDTSFDPLASAANALADPLSNPASASAPKTGTHGVSQPANAMSNVNIPNLAGIGSGVGGVSTPAVQSGGGGGGSAGGGNGTANLLNALGVQGAFSALTAGAANVAHAAPPSVTTPLAGNRESSLPLLNAVNPGIIIRPRHGPKLGDPPINATEGVMWQGCPTFGNVGRLKA